MADFNVQLSGKTAAKITKWKVKKGSRIYKSSLFCLYQEVGSTGIKRLKSEHVGTVLELLVTEGQVVEAGGHVLKVEGCRHPTLMKDMCAECGADLRESQGLPGDRKDLATASVAMVHSIPELIVSQELAVDLGKRDEQRLLDSRKLVLLVDLDQTLLHTTHDNVPPNLKDAYHFQLRHGSNMLWYHTMFRPHTRQFLDSISELYELHICTFGVRMYAHTMAGFLDPKGNYFSHRILSRDECFNPSSKTANLKALFPRGDTMVCIIDDREDVWNYAPNLVHVKPYIFFEGTADINAPSSIDKSSKKAEEEDSKEKTPLPPEKEKPKRKVRVIRVPRNGQVVQSESEYASDEPAVFMDRKAPNEQVLLETNSGETVHQDKLATEEEGKTDGDECLKYVPLEATQASDAGENSDKENMGAIEDINKTSQPEIKLDTVPSGSGDTNEENKITDNQENDVVKENQFESSKDESVDSFESKGDTDKNKYVKETQIQSKDRPDDSSKSKDDTDEKKDEETQIESKDRPDDSSESKGDTDEMKDEETQIISKDRPDDSSASKGDTDEKKSIKETQIESQDRPNDSSDSKGDTDEMKDEKTQIESRDKSADFFQSKEEHQSKLKAEQEYDEVIEWEDTDDYLLYLEDILKRIHTAFYNIYDDKKKKDAEINETESSESDLPDLRSIIPYVRKKVLKGTNILFSGVVPINQPMEKSRPYVLAKALGANIHTKFVPPNEENPSNEQDPPPTTHVVAAQIGTAKVNLAKKSKSVKVVTPDWLWSCAIRWERVEEGLYPLTEARAATAVQARDSPDVIRMKRAPRTDVAEPTDNPAPARRTGDRKFSNSYNPLYAFSKEDMAEMDQEVEALLDDESDTNSTTAGKQGSGSNSSDDSSSLEADKDVSKEEEELRRVVLGYGKRQRQDSSSDESLSGEFPRGWGVVRKRLCPNVEPEESQDGCGVEDENEEKLKLIEDPGRIIKMSDNSSDSADGDSVGSVDDELAAAVEREFLHY